MEEAMSYFTKLSEDERMQELAYDEYRRKMDYRLDKQGWREEGFEQDRQEGIEQVMQDKKVCKKDGKSEIKKSF
ncbi:MAG: hypothetical protein GDA46_06850 [Bdellovibrionales bacterium]|nr:hypothetical protein [Bdellovibrionales bacterium]